MSGISTHVLDTARGAPAASVPVTLEIRANDGSWRHVGRGTTDADGRLRGITPPDFQLERAEYRITFDTAAYFGLLGITGFYPSVVVTFLIRDATQHYHVPLLLSPFGYSTYRGS